MAKYQWIAYGLDMVGHVIIETDGADMHESMDKAKKELLDNHIIFDTLEPFDKSFIKRRGWLVD